MKFNIKFSFIALLLAGFSMQAQKLSPDLRMMIDQKALPSTEKRLSINSFGAEGEAKAEPQTVKVFVSLDDEAAINELSATEGVTVDGVYGGVVTATVDINHIDKLTALKSLKYVQLGTPVKLLNNFGRYVMKVDDIHKNTNDVLPRPYTGKGIVVGMIDNGLEYAHPAFYNADRTELRIRRVWDQNRGGTPPEGFTYGSEYKTQADILNRTCDTQQTYHASHTTGTAAGGDRRSQYYGMAPDADIVYVSFDQSSNTAIADAIQYIFRYADEVNKPCVINMSLGSHYGPHDGTSYLDKIIDQLSGPGRIIVGAAGNEGEYRLHATKTFTASNTLLKTMLTVNENTGHKQHVLDIWGEPGTNLKVNFCMVNSLKGQIASRSSVLDASTDNAHVFYTAYVDTDGAEFDGSIYGEINPEDNRPHVWVNSKLTSINDGKMIGLEVTGTAGSTVHMWNVGQNEFSSNNKTGWTNGNTDCTVGEIGGTANRIISVGSYDGRPYILWADSTYSPMTQFDYYNQFHHSVFSSYGPTADGRQSPHILAPGFPVVSAASRYAIPAEYLDKVISEVQTDDIGRSYYYVYDMGTSMAAPAVAGTIALMLEARPDLTPEEAKDIIMNTAGTEDYMGDLPNNTYGAGHLNALDCVVNTLQVTAIEEVFGDDDLDASRVWSDKSSIYVTTPNVSGNVKAEIYNISGLLVKSVNISEAYTEIDASNLNKGIYIARLYDGSNAKSFKILL